MHRFRKKSDARPEASTNSIHSQASDDHSALPELPPPNDFRTSLILPDLSRRFSLLRTSTGEPVTVETLKSRFAEQRAQGVENQISEEEEDMILATLGRFRSRNQVTPQASHNTQGGDNDPTNQSVLSSNPQASIPSTLSTPSGRPAKRYSNNLFSSGRFRDYSYLRGVGQGKQNRPSITPTEASSPGSQAAELSDSTTTTPDGLRPTSPDVAAYPASAESNTTESTSVRVAPIIPTPPFGDSSSSQTNGEYNEVLKPSTVKRVSRALEQVIKEMEEEVDDEILMPRSPVATRGGLGQSRQSPEGDSQRTQSPAVLETGMAISSDKQVLPSSTEKQRASPIPSRVVPGYTPGMPRPMTPRDFDLDEQRSHSTTPRATSPTHHLSYSDSSSDGLTTLMSRGSTSPAATRSPPRSSSPHSTTSTPLFLQRSLNGRQTPEGNRATTDSISADPINPLSILARRRPASPLSNTTSNFQALTVSPRPTTPTNNLSNGYQKSGHMRTGSWASDGVGNPELQELRSPGRSLHSPALPDSPMLERAQSPTSVYANDSVLPPGSPAMSAVELGSPMMLSSRILRSPTPTQAPTRSPTSPTFGPSISKNGHKRTSKRGSTSSPFGSSPFANLVFSPAANSSRSSLESMGSSYHSSEDERKDRTLGLFAEPGPQNVSSWHDIPISEKPSWSNGVSLVEDESDPEGVIQRYAGLRKADFVAIQEKLVNVALVKSASSDSRDRAPSIRRRRPSTSQSNYSYNGRDRVASPPPQIAQPVGSAVSSAPTPDICPQVNTPNVEFDNTEAREGVIQPTIVNPAFAPSTASLEVSPITRRNRDLAQVLFGPRGDQSPEPPKPDITNLRTPLSPRSPATSQEALYTASKEKEFSSALSPKSPYLTRMPSTPRLPQDEAALTLQVQRKIEAATRSLNKLPTGHETVPTIRKRINPQQIGAPHLISSSASLDTIPIPPPSSMGHGSAPILATSPSKPSRFKMLKGSLRSKPTHHEERTPTFSTNQQPSPPASQLANYDPARLRVPGPSGVVSSAGPTESKFKMSLPNPPASAGPSFKGFMARLRGKPARVPDPVPEHDVQPTFAPLQLQLELKESVPQPQSDESSSTAPERALSLLPAPSQQQNQPQAQPQQQTQAQASPPPSLSPAGASSDSNIVPTRVQTPQLPPIQAHTSNPSTDTTESLRQLFMAASNLNIDPSELGALVARSTSLSATNHPASGSGQRNNRSRKQAGEQTVQEDSSTDEAPVLNPPMTVSHQDKDARPISPGSVYEDSIRPTSPYVRASSRSASPIVTRDHQVASPLPTASVRRKSVRKTMDGSTRRPRENVSDNAQNPVVRRTIIVPSALGFNGTPEFDFAALLSKATMNGTSVINGGGNPRVSISVRSIQDRAPTPPPPKSPTSGRFPLEGTAPPVPLLHGSPTTRQYQENGVGNGNGNGNGVENGYDTSYSHYPGESRSRAASPSGGRSERNVPVGTSGFDQGDAAFNGESAIPTVELLELANGETIWQIVHGLRDEDDDFMYPTRNSFASEYSTQENDNGLQIFVKEHARSGSKGSTTSYLSRRRPAATVNYGKARPETKVFHTTSDQIGRLIESLSQGMDSGSFNFLPSPSPRKATFSHQQSPPPHQQGHQYLHTNGNGHGNGHAHAHSITSSVSTMNTMDREFDHLLKVVNPTQKLT